MKKFLFFIFLLIASVNIKADVTSGHSVCRYVDSPFDYGELKVENAKYDYANRCFLLDYQIINGAKKGSGFVLQSASIKITIQFDYIKEQNPLISTPQAVTPYTYTINVLDTRWSGNLKPGENSKYIKLRYNYAPPAAGLQFPGEPLPGKIVIKQIITDIVGPRCGKITTD